MAQDLCSSWGPREFIPQNACISESSGSSHELVPSSTWQRVEVAEAQPQHWAESRSEGKGVCMGAK